MNAKPVSIKLKFQFRCSQAIRTCVCHGPLSFLFHGQYQSNRALRVSSTQIQVVICADTVEAVATQ